MERLRSPLSLCEREQLLTSLRVIRDAGEGFIGRQEARKARGQASLEVRPGCQEVKLLSVLRTKITSVTSLPSCPPNFCSSDCTPPRPSPFSEGACDGLSGTLSCNDGQSLCKPPPKYRVQRLRCRKGEKE